MNVNEMTPERRDWTLTTPDIVQLGMLAADARRSAAGDDATFVRVDDVSVEQASAWHVAADAGEVRLAGRPQDLDAAAQAVRALAAQGVAPVTGFALHDLADAAGTSLPAWLDALREAGLTAVAAARLDRVEDVVLAAVKAADLKILAVAPGVATVGEAWAALLDRVADLQQRYDVFQAFQPLPADVSVTEPSTGYDDMRAVATARLLLPVLPRLQVHWGRAGAKLTQACLLFGANDIDGVPARDPMPHGPRRAVIEEVRRNILAVSMHPVERTASFERRATSAAGAPA